MIPVGPELDAEVARAIGLNVVFMGERQWQIAVGKHRFSPPLYSSSFGPQTQAMLDWLRGKGRRIDIMDMANRDPNWMACLMANGMQQTRGYGATITESLARLVVAVDEQERRAEQ